MSIFFLTKTLVFTELTPSTPTTRGIEYFCFLLFVPLFYVVIREQINKNRSEAKLFKYIKKLNNVLVNQSHNVLFYEGKVEEGAKALTKEVIDTMNVDRCSIWLYNSDKSSIICQQLYIKSEDNWYQNIELFRKDFTPYFDHLLEDPIIIAVNAEEHTATKCFADSYLKPLGIKSMLDVPIIHRGKVIGVICIESFNTHDWNKSEVDFAQMLSSLYTFAYSTKESNILGDELVEFEKFVETSVIISTADSKGKITYVNQKFTDVSGYSLEEVIGQDHNIVNSGHHPKEFWTNMYKTVIVDKGIWNAVCTNRAKDGSLYYVDTFIKAKFDSNNKLVSFSSIRQDMTDLKRKEIEISNRMNAINRSNAVIEFDLDGNIRFANDSFLNTLGYTQDEIVGKHHSLFVENDYKDSEEYKDFWNSLREGKFFRGEITRRKKDGTLIYLQATYNPILGSDGKPYRIMKIATDVTESYNQQMEIEKKNTYLEHAAKILRHDMHSGINTYMPRGLSSLERRLSEDQIKELKLEAPLKMIKEGLRHTQKVYKGVYEFTNLVKKDVVLNRTECNLKDILEDYLSATAYKSQVLIEDLGTLDVNEALFCTSIDNLIRNGLKYNDSSNKYVKIYLKSERKEFGLRKTFICIEDNGRGMSQEDFEYLSKPYTRKEGQQETGTGLGLNICTAILKEHGFSITSEKMIEGGTKIKIKIK
jgi:PAS domain S-box-containing protein